MPERDNRVTDAINDVITRTVAVAGLGGIALVHVLQSPDAFAAQTYLGLLFVVAIVASLVLAAILTRTSDPLAVSAAGGLATLILIGYILSRTSGLPGFTADIGEWTEPLGLLSMVVEGMLVCLTAAVLATHPAMARSAGTRGLTTPPGRAARAN